MADVNEILADWQAKTDAATEGHWEAPQEDTCDIFSGRYRDWETGLDDFQTYVGSGATAANAEFIAAARTAMPALLAAVKNVLVLHHWMPAVRFGPERCAYCSGAWPCATVRTITAALAAEPDSGSER